MDRWIDGGKGSISRGRTNSDASETQARKSIRSFVEILFFFLRASQMNLSKKICFDSNEIFYFIFLLFYNFFSSFFFFFCYNGSFHQPQNNITIYWNHNTFILSENRLAMIIIIIIINLVTKDQLRFIRKIENALEIDSYNSSNFIIDRSNIVYFLY